MIELNTTVARQNFNDFINRAVYGREVIVLTRRGRPVAVLSPIDRLAERVAGQIMAANADK